MGADYVTVLGVTDNLTIKGCIDAAEHYGKEIVVDMICVTDMPKRIRELEELGAHGMAVHVAQTSRQRGANLLMTCVSWQSTARRQNLCCRRHSLRRLRNSGLKPEVLIVGSGIAHAADPAGAAKAIKDSMKECE